MSSYLSPKVPSSYVALRGRDNVVYRIPGGVVRSLKLMPMVTTSSTEDPSCPVFDLLVGALFFFLPGVPLVLDVSSALG